MQTLAAVLILGSVVVEISYLIFGMLEAVYEKVISFCHKRSKTTKKKKRILMEENAEDSRQDDQERQGEGDYQRQMKKEKALYPSDEVGSRKMLDFDEKNSQRGGLQNKQEDLRVGSQQELFPNMRRWGDKAEIQWDLEEPNQNDIRPPVSIEIEEKNFRMKKGKKSQKIMQKDFWKNKKLGMKPPLGRNIRPNRYPSELKKSEKKMLMGRPSHGFREDGENRAAHPKRKNVIKRVEINHLPPGLQNSSEWSF